MNTIDPIVYGQAKAYRVTFFNSDSNEPINTSGWTLHIGFGSNRMSLGSITKITGQPTESDSASGIITAELTAEQASLFLAENCFVDFSVSTGSTTVPLFLGMARVLHEEAFRQQYFSRQYSQNNLMQSTPSVVIGSSSKQEIVLNFSTQMDPTFDIGVSVKFDELSPQTKKYLDDLQADVATKHAAVMES